MTREQMLKKLNGLKKPFVEFSGTCVAGFDMDVATADGAGTSCWAWGSREVEGPVRLTAALRDRVKAADPDAGDEDPLDDLDEDVAAVYRGMVAAKCKTGVDYFHVLASEDGDRFFSTKYDTVYDEWAFPAVMTAELTPWTEMKDEELAGWIDRLVLDSKRAAKTTSNRRSRGAGKRGA